jgi:hypothetical protein
MLDQKVWIRVKYSYNSDKLDFIGNHTVGVMVEGTFYERIIIFGGIQNVVQSLKTEQVPQSKRSNNLLQLPSKP